MYIYWIYLRNGLIERLLKKKKCIFLLEYLVKKNFGIEYMILNDKYDKLL